MRSSINNLLMALAMVASGAICIGAQPGSTEVEWRHALNQPRAWYATPAAVTIADNLLLYQRKSGGWPKNIDMAAPLNESGRAELGRQKSEVDATIDNGATYSQLIFLARVFTATQSARHRDAFLAGLDYLLKAQYDNGGWPQYFPIRKGYYQHITFNDDAMIGVLRLLRDIVNKQPDYLFVDGPRRERAARAIDKGIECILNTKVVVNGRRTVWCAQHDE